MKLMFYTFLAISLIFTAALIVKNLIKKPFCSLCVAIASTWLVLLFLYKTDRFSNLVLLALLVGQSITGIFYLAYRRLPRSLRIFSLPFFLTMTAIGYVLISGEVELSVFGLLTVLWLLAWAGFIYAGDPGRAKAAKAITNCCDEDI